MSLDFLILLLNQGKRSILCLIELTRAGTHEVAWFPRGLGALLMALAMGGVAGSAAAAPAVTDLRAAANGSGTRIVIEITGPVDFTVFTLVDPYRVVVDLPQVAWRLPNRPVRLETPAVLGVRYGQFEADRARIVLDLSGPTAVQNAFLLAPTSTQNYRLVIDLLGAAAGLAPPAVDVPPQPQESPLAEVVAAALAVPLPKPKPVVTMPVVVIDAGHGGVDPGAQGISGIWEKDITLAAALELGRMLSATGRYTVVMTRKDDTFLSLKQRVDVARKAGADLFVSLHCDAIADPAVRGATVYTVSEKASDDEAQQLANKENDTDRRAGLELILADYDVDTSNILVDLMRRESMNAAARFAGRLSEEVGRVAKLRRNNHRFAGFRVLKAPDVPSVLFEMGYLSNRKDEAILKGPSTRRQLLKAVVAAVDSHFALVSALQQP